jgi:hypothetical protein
VNLDQERRASLAASVTRALCQSFPNSNSGLRGSLAVATADPYSDIDVFWELPDSVFEDAVDCLDEILADVAALDSLRSDPMLQNSEKRRLVFAQFADYPLFWRVDIEVFAKSIHRDESYDLDNPMARGDEWSLTESALMNSVAAMKYLLRDDRDRAEESIERAFARIDEGVPDGESWDAIAELTEMVGRRDLEQAELVRRVQELLRDARPGVDRR